MSTITLANLRLNYRQVGHGPDVLLIHGWVSSLRMWADTQDRLAAAGYRATALDLPGFGASDRPAFDWYSLDRYTQLLQAFVQRFNLQQPAVVGHSLGATLTLSLAATVPVRAVVACAPIVNGGLYGHRFLAATPTRRLVRRWQAHPLFGLLGEMSPVSMPGLARTDAQRRNQEDLGRTTYTAATGSLRTLIDLRLEERLRTIIAPTLILVGTRDLTVRPGQGRLAARLIPGARLVEWRGVGHGLLDDRPQQFHALLLEHLSHTVPALSLNPASSNC